MGIQHIDRAQMKLDARAAMREHRPSVFMIAFLFLVITYVLSALDTKLQFPGLTLNELYRIAYDDALFEAVFNNVIKHRTVASGFLSFAIAIMTLMLSGGFTMVCLNVVRRAPANIGTLFDMFNYFFRYIWLTILMAIFIFLWSLLLVVPGIIAAYRYSMAIFIFIDDPNKGAIQCIRESKEMTRGYKGQLFVLDLSFLGWLILSIIPLVSIFTHPYIETTRANFYRAIRGEYGAQPQYRDYRDPWAQ